ncbi:MAG: 2OG-Fe(II) oxygenase [Burkholderiaceae bacterium]|nr:2OG-Fe(II) oxygenase [Burkholderiaceae bacterium]
MLFDFPIPPPVPLPDGVAYQPEFLSAQEEAALIQLVGTLGLQAARYKAYTARRRVASFGGSYDYDSNRLLPAAELIPDLHPLRERVARWLGVAPEAIVHALVAEYPPGAPLGWHRDVPDFEDIAGVSLGAEGLMRFRPWPAVRPKRSDILRLRVAPRSIYAIRGTARWRWQHSVAPGEARRWSITFRTRRT